MQHTMETDHPLPVPMHRPYITLNPQHDTPLPFRRVLGQVTELTAENSTPYKPLTKHELSTFERLPLEIRERIYMYLGIYSCHSSLGQMVGPRDVEILRCDRPWQFKCRRDNENADPVCLYINHSIREEVLDVLFGKVTAEFHFYLSDRKIYRDNWHSWAQNAKLP
jgi:hypothetical protein